MYLLIATTVLSFLSAWSSFYTKRLIAWLRKPTSKERELLKKISELREEQNQISMTDNFAVHAKLQRKINRLEMTLNLSNERFVTSYTFHVAVTYGTKFFWGLILLSVAIYYRYTPVYVFSESFDWFPLSTIISFPNQEAGAISVHFWLLVSNTVARQLCR